MRKRNTFRRRHFCSSLLQNVSERLEETREEAVTVRVPSSGSVVFDTSSAVVTITPHSFAFVPMGLRAANITRRRNSSSDDEVSITIVFLNKATFRLLFQDYVKAMEQQPPSYDQVVKDDLDAAAKRSRY